MDVRAYPDYYIIIAIAEKSWNFKDPPILLFFKFLICFFFPSFISLSSPSFLRSFFPSFLPPFFVTVTWHCKGWGQATPRMAAVACRLFWAEGNQDPAAPEKFWPFLNNMETYKLEVFSRIMIVTTGKFYLSDLSGDLSVWSDDT